MNTRPIAVALAMLLAVVSLPSGAQAVRPVPSLDLTRYVGKWHEIARFPNKFQEKCVSNVTADYALRTDGELDVVNRCRRADGGLDEALGRGRVTDAVSNAKLEVRFAPAWLSWVPFVWADYWVVDLAPDYATAAVGGPERDYLWILSRTPTLPEA